MTDGVDRRSKLLRSALLTLFLTHDFFEQRKCAPIRFRYLRLISLGGIFAKNLELKPHLIQQSVLDGVRSKTYPLFFPKLGKPESGLAIKASDYTRHPFEFATKITERKIFYFREDTFIYLRFHAHNLLLKTPSESHIDGEAKMGPPSCLLLELSHEINTIKEIVVFCRLDRGRFCAKPSMRANAFTHKELESGSEFQGFTVFMEGLFV